MKTHREFILHNQVRLITLSFANATVYSNIMNTINIKVIKLTKIEIELFSANLK